MKKRLLLLCLGCALFLLCACGSPAALPPLGLLALPTASAPASEAAQSGAQDDVLRVDLWLDASQLAGGVNPNEESLYPHFGKRFREGGFHYRLGNSAGWYESVLKDALETVEGSRVRVLRVGNERLPDSFLQRMGFSFATEEEGRSLRRDLLTYAVDPLPDVFSAMSGEDMTDRFYTLFSPQLNQMSRFLANDGAVLENPGQTEKMSAALEAQRAARDGLDATGNDADSPLFYALENLDLSRLSLITCDPATLRRLQGSAADGTPRAYLTELLDRRGVFDAGLCVGIYLLRLDYMGQMISFGAADFADPLIWGKPKVDAKTYQAVEAMPMPRAMLLLVVGESGRVASYTAALNRLMDEDESLKGLRGPEKGELTYARNGQTITQQPFSFSYDYTQLSRPAVTPYTQSTPGGTVEAAGGARRDGAFQAALPTKGGTLTLSWPLEAREDGISLDLRAITSARVELKDSLVLTDVLANTPGAAFPANAQVLPLRDKLYVFTKGAGDNPFSLLSLLPSADGTRLIATVGTAGTLQPGYYRLRLVAEISGAQFNFPAVPWAAEADATFTNGELIAWEGFSQTVAKYARKLANVPKEFAHAWGPATDKPYKNVPVPDFPPVEKALHLQELLAQLRQAATVETETLVDCVFDVLVDDTLFP